MRWRRSEASSRAEICADRGRNLFREARGCTRCDLYKHATQTVFGEGPLDARIMFVGEQPGDQEDLAGRPFVGPAGAVFDEALEKAGIPRSEVYVTNAVKHFKFEQRGKKRIHSKPNAGEIEACRWWIDQERALIRPPVTVALGATAARSILDKVVTISRVRGSPIPLSDGGECWVTVHPSFLLRIPEEDRKREERAKVRRRPQSAFATALRSCPARIPNRSCALTDRGAPGAILLSPLVIGK